MHHLVNEILEENTKHPDLLVGDCSAWALVHSVASKCRHEICLEIVNHSFVKVLELASIGPVDASRGRTNFTEYILQLIKIRLEEGVKLVKVSDATVDRLSQMSVCLNQIFLLLNGAIKLEQLEVRLPVTHLGSL